MVLAAVTLVVMLAGVAFALDIGYLALLRTELQRNADAAALAAAWELLEQRLQLGQAPGDPLQIVKAEAALYSASNPISTAAGSLSAYQIVVGALADPNDPSQGVVAAPFSQSHAVQVSLHLDAEQNGPVDLFFAPAIGVQQGEVHATATARFYTAFSGFRTPSGGGNLGILPFALDLESWEALLGGEGEDQYRWNPETNKVEPGSDGVLEVSLYPQGTGSPGNRGTVDIGSDSNSTADIARQILYGISASDLAYHGGSLTFNEAGELYLKGDPGISAGFKDELASIIGQTRMIPIFKDLTGNGNNAVYTIVAFVGVRILDVKLTGRNKFLMIQPAGVVTRGGIPAQGNEAITQFIYSPPTLVH